MSVVVVTDTTASVDPGLATEWGIRLVPLSVTVAGRSYRDDEIDVSTLAGARATTAGPPPGDFLAALQDAPAGAVVVTFVRSATRRGQRRTRFGSWDAWIHLTDSSAVAGFQASPPLRPGRLGSSSCSHCRTGRSG